MSILENISLQAMSVFHFYFCKADIVSSYDRKCFIGTHGNISYHKNESFLSKFKLLSSSQQPRTFSLADKS